MKFVELTKDEFNKFSKKHEQESFFQTIETADLRKSYGSKIHYLGVKKGKEIIAAGMFSETPCMFGKNRFHSPQGFIADYNDLELLKFFTSNIKKYAKKCNAMFIKIEPNIIYQLHKADGSLYEDAVPNDLAINNLKKLGYKHFGFTKEYRFTQSRWNYRLVLDKPYEELRKEFSKSTRKNIDAMYDKGVKIRRGNEKDIEAMTYLLQSTAERKHFRYRDLEYYKRMYKYFGDLMQIYIAYVDSDLYLENAHRHLKEEEEHKDIILEKMNREKVGNKLKNELETCEKLIEKLKLEVEEAKEFKNTYPNGKDVGGLLSIKSGQEYVTLTSGILEDAKKFKPKYIMYNEHIKDAYEYGFKYVNFYGISGVFDKSNPIYGVYEFKRGFGGEVVELIGEFTLKISNTYYIYNIFRHLKILLRKITKR